MKINKIKSLLLAVIAVATVSCTDENNSFMVPDKIGFLNSGLVEAEVFSGIQNPTQVVVIKSGKGFVGANMDLKVNESILTSYNEEQGTSYVVIPQNCYTLQVSHLEFSASDYRKSFEIVWDQTALATALASGVDYALPLQLVNNTSETIEMASDRRAQIIVPTIEQPVVKIEASRNSAGVFIGEIPSVKSLDEFLAYFSVSTNFVPDGELEYTIEIDNSLVEKYNQENGTSYLEFPSSLYSFEKMNWSLASRQMQGYFRMTLHEKTLYVSDTDIKFGNYLLPIKLASVSQGNIDADEGVILYLLQFQPSEIDRSTWTVPSDGYNISIQDDTSALYRATGKPENVIDGDLSSAWRTLWSKPQLPPFYITIDMGSVQTIARLGFDNPTGSKVNDGTAKSGKFEVSVDGESWTTAATFEAEYLASNVYVYTNIMKAQYIRLTVEEVYPYNNNESYLGRMGIAEIRAWGL